VGLVSCPYRGLDNSLKNFLVSVPLVADLRSPAMRDRHWSLLMETTQAGRAAGALVCSAGCDVARHAWGAL
jgi:hypothetical protein